MATNKSVLDLVVQPTLSSTDSFVSVVNGTVSRTAVSTLLAKSNNWSDTTNKPFDNISVSDFTVTSDTLGGTTTLNINSTIKNSVHTHANKTTLDKFSTNASSELRWNDNPVYTLPTASTTVLGGVKVDGTTITINNGVISGANTYVLPTATTTTLGGVKIDGETITIDEDGVISGTATYTLPTASTTVLGGVKVDGTTISITDGVISSTVDTSNFITKTNPTGTGSLSMNRTSGSTVGEFSNTIGYNNTASGNISSAIGIGNTVSGTQSVAVGNSNTESGTYNFLFGTSSNVTGTSNIALGSGNTITASRAHAIGNNLTVNSSDEIVLGKYNTLDGTNTKIFVIGNGTSTSSRSDALTLSNDGNLVVSGTITDGQGHVLSDSGIDFSELSDMLTEGTLTGLTITPDTTNEVFNFEVTGIPVLDINSNGYWTINGELPTNPTKAQGNTGDSLDATVVTGGIQIKKRTYDGTETIIGTLTNGADGVSPTATVTTTSDSVTISITDSQGTHSGTMSIEIDAFTNNWIINGTDTGVCAKGEVTSAELTALTARVTALETTIGNLNTLLENRLNGNSNSESGDE